MEHIKRLYFKTSYSAIFLQNYFYLKKKRERKWEEEREEKIAGAILPLSMVAFELY